MPPHRNGLSRRAFVKGLGAAMAGSAFVPPLLSEINKVVVGQKYLVERLIIGLLANGHVPLEGVPGLAKTLSVKSLAAAIHGGGQARTGSRGHVGRVRATDARDR